MSNQQEENDDWALAFGKFFDLYFNPANAAQESEANGDDNLIPAGEPRSWDDASWQTGEPEGERRRSGVNAFELEFTPHFYVFAGPCTTNSEQHESAWASMRYMHDLTAGRQEMGAGMRETGDYHDYLRNKRHTFTPEERKHNDKMWDDRREACLKQHVKALKRKAAACAVADKDALQRPAPRAQNLDLSILQNVVAQDEILQFCASLSFVVVDLNGNQLRYILVVIALVFLWGSKW
ncbi:hypothetical protein C8F04DRAFT_1184521 [Mycena alexandri]|uniref:Uncharacterized protein n=1 Tax=Mycena alexandri TaxID=1745969 RepID=A0AAD6X2A0_9AGAR|nr:hypothetical protein C8F04DRAFT_1184521 [Mycena alexandri]